MDRQVVTMEFDRGGTATLTMTAFENGRHLEIFGTKAVLRGGAAVRTMSGADLIVRTHQGESTPTLVEVEEGGYDGHGGGDLGLVLALHEEMKRTHADQMTSSLAVSVESHLVGFAAETSRRTGTVQTMAH